MNINNLLSPSTIPFTICTTLLFLLFLFWLCRSNSFTSGVAAKKTPPEAGGAWPLIGHLLLLGGSQPPHVTLGKLAEKYGPIFTLRLGVHRTLVISSCEMAKECFTVNDRAFASRPKSIAFEILGYNFSMIGFSPYGSYWRTVRKISTLHVLSATRIDMLKHVMESEVKEAMKASYYSCETMVKEMKKWFGDIAVNILFRTVVGERFNGEGEKNQRIRKAFRELFHLCGSFVISDAMPFLRWLDLDGKEKEMKKTAKELDEFVQVWLDQHKRSRVHGKKRDFMDVIISTVDDQEIDGRDAATTIKTTCLVMYFNFNLVILILLFYQFFS